MYVTYCGLPALASVEEHPIINAVLGFAHVLEHLGEKLTKEIIVRGFLEP
jgi:hypothetical protein